MFQSAAREVVIAGRGDGALGGGPRASWCASCTWASAVEGPTIVRYTPPSGRQVTGVTEPVRSIQEMRQHVVQLLPLLVR